MNSPTDDWTPKTIDDDPADVDDVSQHQETEAEVGSASDPLREKDERIHELEEQTKRLSAEFENFRRRQQEDMKRRQVLMKEDLFRSLLPILDNLDRSLEAAKTTNSLDAMLRGVELTRREFGRLFEDNDVLAIETLGQSFDPNLHEAMMVEERHDLPDQSIVSELQKGYRLGERVLRASMVKVSRRPPGVETYA